MSTTKTQLLDLLKENYDSEVAFHVQDIYQLLSNISSTIYSHLEVPTAGVLRDVQELRDDDVLTFVDYNGTYFLNPSSVVDSEQNIFSLEMLERHGRILMWNDKTKTTSAPGITFKQWMIANKNEVMSHTIARELDIPCQTRVDQALFKGTQNEIRDSILSDGYDYHCYQPAVSELNPPVEYQGNVYKYIVRDGNNRFELPWDYFPCALIEGESEYSLLQFGAMANNPNSKEKKNDCTPNDVKHIIRLGFKYGEIEKTEEAVFEILSTRYKETRKKNRRNFVAEILAEEGIKLSIEPYDITKARKHLIENYGVEMNEHDFIMGWGRGSDHYRKLFWMFEHQLENPEVDMKGYYFLEQGPGIDTQPTEKNIVSQRVLMESERKVYINHCCKVADSYRAGQIKPIDVKWLAQANGKEKYNEFQ